VEIIKISRRKFTSAFKSPVAIEAIKERETLADLSKKFGVHAVMISKGKQEFLRLYYRLRGRDQ